MKTRIDFRLFTFVLLAALAAAVLLFPGLAENVAGLRRLGNVSAAELDALEPPQNREAGSFFDSRDEITLEVRRDMTLKEFLLLHQLDNHDHVRAQIARQRGAAALTPDTLLQAGDTYTITLTPPDLDSP